MHINIGGLYAILETKTKRKADELTRLMRQDGWPAMCIVLQIKNTGTIDKCTVRE